MVVTSSGYSTGISSTSPSITLGNGTLSTKISAEDITIGNVSLCASLQKIQDSIDNIEKRVRILQINPDLESRWDELKELGDRYRELEKDFLNTEAVLKALKT